MCVPLQVDKHLNGSFLIVCPGPGSMHVCVCVCVCVCAPASRYAFKWKFSDRVPGVRGHVCGGVGVGGWVGGGSASRYAFR